MHDTEYISDALVPILKGSTSFPILFQFTESGYEWREKRCQGMSPSAQIPIPIQLQLRALTNNRT